MHSDGIKHKPKSQPTEWEKIFADDISDKGLVYKYEVQIELNSKTQPCLKMIRRQEQTFFQRKHTDGQQAHKKMLNITHHQGNTDQNYNEIPLHTCQNG